MDNQAKKIVTKSSTLERRTQQLAIKERKNGLIADDGSLQGDTQRTDECRPEIRAGDKDRTEEVSTPNVTPALSNRIEKFVSYAELEMGFSRW
ncbi:hypothetical protein OSTOST_01441 [Ostertagia ostertagi]